MFNVITHDEQEVQQLIESRNYKRQLGGGYEAVVHQPHNSTGDYHIHLSNDGKEILSMNKSGSAHDGYHGVRIPNKAFKALKAQFPDWNWPADQIIESIDYTLFINRKSADQLRPVQVFPHTTETLKNIEAFQGFFHQFADEPFQTGGNHGWFPRTVALVENMEGRIVVIRKEAFRFLDTQ